MIKKLLNIGDKIQIQLKVSGLARLIYEICNYARLIYKI